MQSFYLLLWKYLLILKILQVTLFKELALAFRNPPGRDSDNSLNCPCMYIKVNFSAVKWEVITGEKRPVTKIVSQRKILMRLSIQVSQFVRVFIEVSKILKFRSLLNNIQYNLYFKNSCFRSVVKSAEVAGRGRISEKKTNYFAMKNLSKT